MGGVMTHEEQLYRSDIRWAKDIDDELNRAAEKHGVYAMETIDFSDSMLALMEEVGEASQAFHEHRLSGKHGAREELVQAAACCVAMIKKLDKGRTDI